MSAALSRFGKTTARRLVPCCSSSRWFSLSRRTIEPSEARSNDGGPSPPGGSLQHRIPTSAGPAHSAIAAGAVVCPKACVPSRTSRCELGDAAWAPPARNPMAVRRIAARWRPNIALGVFDAARPRTLASAGEPDAPEREAPAGAAIPRDRRRERPPEVAAAGAGARLEVVRARDEAMLAAVEALDLDPPGVC